MQYNKSLILIALCCNVVQSLFSSQAQMKTQERIEIKVYEKLDTRTNDALWEVVRNNNIEKLASYLEKYTFNDEEIELALRFALLRKYPKAVQLLLPYYEREDFCVQDGNTTMLSIPSFSPINTEADVLNIIQLIEAGAPPFVETIGGKSSLWEYIQVLGSVSDEAIQRIAQAAQNFPIQEMARMQRKAQARKVIHAALCEQDVLNGVSSLADIIKEYVFGEYKFEEDEPKAIHFHDEK